MDRITRALVDIPARTVIAVILVLDMGAGISWAVGSPVRTSAASYHFARRLLDFLPGYPARWWGGLLALLAVGGLVAVVLRYEFGLRLWVLGVAFYWTCWVFAFSWSAATDGKAGFLSVWVMLITVVGHVRAVGARDLMSAPRAEG